MNMTLMWFNGYRFNKRPEDFPSLRAYNDYLEMVEDISKCDINAVAWIQSC
jgi:hypothetical protein